MNFIMANVDFDRYFSGQKIESGHARFLCACSPKGCRSMHRPQLFEAYAEGIRERLFYPALHGLTHFANGRCQRIECRWRTIELLKTPGKRELRIFTGACRGSGMSTGADLPSARRFLSLEEQRLRIARAAEVFHKLFGRLHQRVCAGYRANADTRTAWFETGVRVAQNDPASEKLPSSMKGEYLYFSHG